MVDPDHDREVDRTTIIERDGGGGSGGVLAVVLLIIVVLVLLFLFRDQLGFGTKETTNINVPDADPARRTGAVPFAGAAPV